MRHPPITHLTLWLTNIERKFTQKQLSKYALIPRQVIIFGFSLGSLEQWGVKTLTETYDWNGTVNLPLSVNTIYSIATTLNSCSNYAIVGVAIQSTTKSSFSVKLDGVNDSSRTTGFKYILVAK